MDEEDDDQIIPLSPRVLLYDIVQQPVPEPQEQEGPARNENPNSVRQSQGREVSPLSDEDILVENFRKRKRRGAVRLTSPTQTQKSLTPPPKKDEQDDDGVLCPICYEEWDMSGVHRLTSLKCGHLFGHSCIKRWLSECPPHARVCPSCKTKATMRDMRFLYAKRLRMMDNSELVHIKQNLEETLTKKAQIESELAHLRMRYEQQVTENNRLTREVRMLRDRSDAAGISHDTTTAAAGPQYRLFMEKNLDIGRDAGCRVIQFGKRSRSLVVSQKSTQHLFPGFGVRFVDVETLRPTTFMHTSNRQIRDLAFDRDAQLLVAASVENVVKVFDVTAKNCNAALRCPDGDLPTAKLIWSSCFDRTHENALIVGCQNGRVARFDLRSPSTPQDLRTQPIDLSPVIDIASIAPDTTLPHGGVIVCTLQNMWLYEFANHGLPRDIIALPLEGPFTAMVYNHSNKCILVTLRPSQAANRYTAQHIVGILDRMGDSVIFKITNRFTGSTSMPSMFRATFIDVPQDTLVAGYVHSTKHLTTWSLRNDQRLQTIAATDPILDFSSFQVNTQNYLGAITETKCRIYKVQ